MRNIKESETADMQQVNRKIITEISANANLIFLIFNRWRNKF